MSRTSAQILAHAISAVVHDLDVTDTLATLVGDCGEVLSAGAVGLLIRSDNGQLELLSASSHGVAELELFQARQTSGPCVDVMSGGSAISVSGSADLLARWPVAGRAIIDGGFRSVHTSPLRWRGMTMGALSALFIDSTPTTHEQALSAQTFADVAALVLMQAVAPSASDVSESIGSALTGRIIIEQAKGVLASQETLGMAAAYDTLVRMAKRNGASLTATAEGVVAGARKGPRHF